MFSSLVIGYGNDLRGDDAVGPQIAILVANCQLPNLRSLAVQQLTPELAELIAQVDLVIFVDACPAIETIQLQSLQPLPSGTLDAHLGDPRSLLALAKILYSHVPESWWLWVPAQDFAFGASLSVLAQQSIPQALLEIQQLIFSRNRLPLSEEHQPCTKLI